MESLYTSFILWGNAYCPVRPFLSCSAILLMSQASIVGSTLCFPSPKIHILNSKWFSWMFLPMFEMGGQTPHTQKLPQGSGMGLNSIAFSKNPLLISTFNTFIFAKWLRVFRFTRLVSIISFANPSWWSHNSTCNVASTVLSPQLKLILKYFHILFYHMSFS